MNLKNERTKGFLYALFAFFFWGSFSPFFKLYSTDISSYEILIHRIIWSVVFLAIVLYFLGGFSSVAQILRHKKIRNALLTSGFLISLNWWTYVLAVSSGQILEAGLGQFLTPLISMMLGALIFKEKLSGVAKFAIFIVFLAVLLQVYALGNFPVVALMLGLSFAFYGVIRKRVKVPGIAAIFVETLLLLPLCFGYFLYLFFANQSHFDADLNGFLMIASGVITVVPLIIYNMATARVDLSILGFMQYIIPTMSVGFGIYFGEELGVLKFCSFALIWFAIVLVSVDGILRKRGKNATK
ncbi:EamA family transporter RarD [Campylobacter mucosalis]|uniref:EamA family transporter RarD n=1 Tax=Campylobacter mucosalis TaxID=202 RepID=UPI0014706C3D|nr:EamA family transporter RarD [Campylobacter mucosalis]